jgi:hypothetical protein
MRLTGTNRSGDLSARVQAAVNAAVGRRLIVPSGTYTLDSKISLPAGTTLIGEASSSPNTGAVFVAGAAISGGLLEATGQVHVENLTLKCEHLADHGLKITTGGGSQSLVSNIWVEKSVDDAYFFDRCQSGRWGRLYARENIGGHGFNFVDCNALMVDLLSAQRFESGNASLAPNADKYAVRMAGVSNSGGMTISTLIAENHWYGGLLVEGCSSRPVVREFRSELGGNGAADHIVIRDRDSSKSYGVTIDNALCVGGNATFTDGTYAGENNRCLRVLNSNQVTVRNFQVAGSAGTTWTRPLFGAGARDCVIESPVYHSASGPSPLDVDNEGGLALSVSNRHQFRASAAPTTGIWRAGDITWNSAPASGQPVGWVCTAGGQPGTWLGFGAVA